MIWKSPKPRIAEERKINLSAHHADTIVIVNENDIFGALVPRKKHCHFSRFAFRDARFGTKPVQWNRDCGVGRCGSHHAICYAAMLDYAAANWQSMPPLDQSCAACILGPNNANPAGP
jgi:hypothetical protein